MRHCFLDRNYRILTFALTATFAFSALYLADLEDSQARLRKDPLRMAFTKRSGGGGNLQETKRILQEVRLEDNDRDYCC